MRLTLLFCLVVLFSCNNNSDFERKNGAYEALQMLADQRAYPEKDLSKARYFQEIEKFSNPLFPLNREKFPEPWESLGPHNIAGRTLALALNPQNTKTLWCGSASGGLWRSYNQGRDVSWEQVRLGFPVLGVSSIAFAPGDSLTMYIGTGEVYNVNQSGNGAAFRSTRGTYGIGILKSIDGGETWEKTLDWSYQLNRGIHAVKVSQSNPELIFAGTTEGLFVSEDAGTNWTLNLPFPMANDLLVHQENPDKIIVGCGNLNSSDKGIYTTSDGGESWTNELPQDFNGKIQFAQDPSNINTVYASIGNGFGFSDGATWVYKSLDFGVTWTLMNETDYSKWQGWFAHDIAVNPDDSDKLTMIGIEVYSSSDGAQNIEQSTIGGVAFGTPEVGKPDGPSNFTHSDHHDVLYDPNDGNLVYVGNDGGVYASQDGGQNWESRNGGLQTSQFYNGFSVFESADEVLAIGGLQDNSTVEYSGSKAWNRVIGGDGSWSALHSSDANIRYGSFQNLGIRRSLDGNNYFGLDIPGNEFPTAFIAPFVLAPSSPDIIYAGRDRVLKSLNGGDDWVVQGSLGADFLFSMDVSKTNEDVLYVATAPNIERSKIFMTKDGGGSYTEITNDLPDAYINDIHVSSQDPERAFITLGGFGGQHVFKTEDSGSSWKNITGNLPAIPTSAVLADPQNDSLLYVGNDFGVFFSEDAGVSWSMFNEGLGDAVMVMDLKFNDASKKIYVATHGNGAYERDMIETDLPSAIVDEVNSKVRLLQNPVQDYLTLEHIDLPCKYTIYNLNGQALQSGSLTQKGNIDIKNLNNGTYFININKSGQQKSQKFIKIN